jgi:hypothetical protein
MPLTHPAQAPRFRARGQQCWPGRVLRVYSCALCAPPSQTPRLAPSVSPQSPSVRVFSPPALPPARAPALQLSAAAPPEARVALAGGGRATWGRIPPLRSRAGPPSIGALGARALAGVLSPALASRAAWGDRMLSEAANGSARCRTGPHTAAPGARKLGKDTSRELRSCPCNCHSPVGCSRPRHIAACNCITAEREMSRGGDIQTFPEQAVAGGADADSCRYEPVPWESVCATEGTQGGFVAKRSRLAAALRAALRVSPNVDEPFQLQCRMKPLSSIRRRDECGGDWAGEPCGASSAQALSFRNAQRMAAAGSQAESRA